MKKQFDTKNDIVFTPDYVADLMCKLAGVNEESVVLDNACGNGQLLQAALKYNPKKVVGIEYERIIFDMMSEELANANQRVQLICGDGLKDENIPDDANVLLINPPYSSEGRGLVFAERALSKIKKGMAVILIQSSAGNNADFTARLLKNNKLIASIKMADIFKGFASVDTSIYVLECGTPHKEDDVVKFIDFSNDGYRRSGRKTQLGKVTDVDNATLRYKEVATVVYKNPDTDFYKDLYIEDTVSLDGGGWNYANHFVFDTTPTKEDFERTVRKYLEWRVLDAMRNGTDKK